MITYNEYCSTLDGIKLLDESGILYSEGLMDVVQGVKGQIAKMFMAVKSELSNIDTELRISTRDLIQAFKNRDVFEILKQFGFSFKKMMAGIHKATGLINKGLISIFTDLHKTGVFKKLRNGTIAIDDLFEKHPILKKVSGPVVAGLLLIVWLNISFIGNFDYDMDVSAIFNAISGNFSLHDLFVSPAGLAMLTFVATNMASGGVLSVSWLGATKANLAIAVIYTAMKNVNKHVPQLKAIIGK